VSCASGKLASAGVPPELVAQGTPAAQEPPAVKLQYTVFGVDAVKPLLPPQSPILVPDQVAAPAHLISRKSILLRFDTEAAVIVYCVPNVPLNKNMRLDALLVPCVNVRVPFTVILDDMLHCLYPVVPGFHMVKLLNVTGKID